MHTHGSSCLVGPVRGTRGWWSELGKRSDVAPLPRKAGRRKKAAGVRTELVERVRKEIAAGTYDTPAKWQAALDRLLDSLTAE